MSGNGVDLGTIAAMLQTVIQSQAEFGSRLGRVESDMRDVVRELKDMREELKGVRQELGMYHSSMLGHGMLISELDDRVTMLEQRPEHPLAA